MKGVTVTPLRQIATPGGAVYHGLRNTDPGYASFGEAYFSTVEKGAVKGWKRHRRMVMNLVVPVGRVRFVVHEDGTPDDCEIFDLSAEADSYARLTVEPGLWMAFTGLGDGLNLILNLASILHDPDETDRRDVDLATWRWAERAARVAA